MDPLLPGDFAAVPEVRRSVKVETDLGVRNKERKLKVSKQQVYVCVALAALTAGLTGCSAPRGLQHEVMPPEVVKDSPQATSVEHFAQAVGTFEVGTTTVMNNTQLGLAQVHVERVFKNALGEACRRVIVKNNETQRRGAVCQGADGVWRYVDASL